MFRKTALALTTATALFGTAAFAGGHSKDIVETAAIFMRWR